MLTATNRRGVPGCRRSTRRRLVLFCSTGCCTCGAVCSSYPRHIDAQLSSAVLARRRKLIRRKESSNLLPASFCATDTRPNVLSIWPPASSEHLVKTVAGCFSPSASGMPCCTHPDSMLGHVTESPQPAWLKHPTSIAGSCGRCITVATV